MKIVTVDKNVLNIYPQLNILKKYIENNSGIIAGGCFKNIFTNTKIKDIDIFFRNNDDFMTVLKQFNKLKNLEQIYDNGNVVGYKDKVNGITVELVRKFFSDSPEDVIGKFDFTITKAAFYSKPDGYVFICHDKFFEHLLLKRLVVDDKMVNPVNTFNRTYRYTRYGYNLCIESKVKIIKAIMEIEELAPDKITDELSRALYDSLD